jgi:hypothetical protein
MRWILPKLTGQSKRIYSLPFSIVVDFLSARPAEFSTVKFFEFSNRIVNGFSLPADFTGGKPRRKKAGGRERVVS